MAITIDGTAHNNSAGATTLTATLTTTQPNDLICVYITTNTSAPVTSVTSAHVTFTRKLANATSGQIELWSGVASAALTSEVITVNQTTSNFITVDAFGLNGVDTTTIWYGAGVTSNATPSDPLTISTTNASDIIIAGFRMATVASGAGAGAGFTILNSADYQTIEYDIVSVTQSGLSIALAAGNGAGDSNGSAAIAIKAAPTGPQPIGWAESEF